MKLHASGEDYLETILVLQKKLGMVRSVDVARHMEVSKPSVCHAVATLRDGGKEAHTVYHRLKAFNAGYSLVEAELLTGRTHQLRVHFAYIGNPIVGDAKYGDFEVNDFFKRMYSYRNQFLHASYFRFKESLRKGPLSYLAGKEFVSPLPKKETEIIDSIKRID